MKWLVFALTLFFIGPAVAQSSYVDEIQKERSERDAEFANPETSILLEADLASFKGLDYFPITEKYKVQVLQIKRFKRKKTFEMTTTTARRPLYKPYAQLTFSMDGKESKLTVYQNMELIKKQGFEDYLFIPFTDLTSGEECYGGGRYLDFRISDLDKKEIDFNKAYNPYCAYNAKYSCPIPPSENALDVRVEAGVKKFHE